MIPFFTIEKTDPDSDSDPDPDIHPGAPLCRAEQSHAFEARSITLELFPCFFMNRANYPSFDRDSITGSNLAQS